MTFWPISMTSYNDIPTNQTFHPISWPWYQTWPSPDNTLFPWSICNRFGMPAGNPYPFQTPGSVPLLGTCLCFNCWDQIPRTCRVFSWLFTLDTPRYFLNFASMTDECLTPSTSNLVHWHASMCRWSLLLKSSVIQGQGHIWTLLSSGCISVSRTHLVTGDMRTCVPWTCKFPNAWAAPPSLIAKHLYEPESSDVTLWMVRPWLVFSNFGPKSSRLFSEIQSLMKYCKILIICMTLFWQGSHSLYIRKTFFFPIWQLLFYKHNIRNYWCGIYFGISRLSGIDRKIKNSQIKSVLQYYNSNYKNLSENLFQVRR